MFLQLSKLKSNNVTPQASDRESNRQKNNQNSLRRESAGVTSIQNMRSL